VTVANKLRAKEKKRPIIFIGHSFGGIVVKQVQDVQNVEEFSSQDG
jgi:hypothetical protein